MANDATCNVQSIAISKVNDVEYRIERSELERGISSACSVRCGKFKRG
jgi:hypothetical protein